MSTSDRKAQWGLFAALGAAVAASACCVIPLLLVGLGVGGAWVSAVTALEPFRPFFIALALWALAYAVYREWRVSRGPECDCDTGMSNKMRRSLLTVGLIAAVGLVASPWVIRGAASEGPATVVAMAESERVILEVEGMTCASCTVSVQKVLAKLDGVQEVRVTFEPPEAVVVYDPAKADLADLMGAVESVGYSSELKREK